MGKWNAFKEKESGMVKVHGSALFLFFCFTLLAGGMLGAKINSEYAKRENLPNLKYGDKVELIEGFHAGLTGEVRDYSWPRGYFVKTSRSSATGSYKRGQLKLIEEAK